MARSEKAWRGAAAVVFWLLLWQGAAMLANRSLLIAVPTPVRTAAALGRLCGEGSFWKDAALSLLRILAGFLAALAAGLGCAVLSARSRLFAALGKPLVKTLRAIPVASFTILVFLWVPRAAIPGFISFLTVFPIVWGQCETGLSAVDGQLVELGRVMGLGRRSVFRFIRWPALRPHLAGAVTGGIGFAWKSGVAAEIICRAQDSLGNRMWIEKNALEYDAVFALTVVIVLLSAALDALVRRLMRGWSA